MDNPMDTAKEDVLITPPPRGQVADWKNGAPKNWYSLNLDISTYVHIYIYIYIWPGYIWYTLQALCPLGTRMVPTPPKDNVDGRVAKLEKLKRLQDAIQTLVNLRYLKKMRESALNSKPTYGNLIAFFIHIIYCASGMSMQSRIDVLDPNRSFNLGTDNMETQPMVEAPQGETSPAPTEIGPVWEAADAADLKAAEVEAESAKDKYFSDENKHEKPELSAAVETAEQSVETTSDQNTGEGPANKAEHGGLGTKPGLELKVNNDKWKTKHVPKDATKKDGSESTVKLQETKSLPSKPSTWGQAPFISPDEQAPPKKRGRKPLEKDEGKKKRGRSSNKKKEPVRGTKRKEKASRVSAAKKARIEKAEESEEPNTTTRKRAKSTQEQPPKESASKRLRKYLLDEKEKHNQRLAAAKSKSTKDTQTRKSKEAPSTDIADRKARVSRKSSAYHKAYAATKGTEEEKRIAAKKVL